jgi:hypothetical protein
VKKVKEVFKKDDIKKKIRVGIKEKKIKNEIVKKMLGNSVDV